MQINPNLVYKIGEGGLVDGKLIFLHPNKIKKRPWVARCFRKADSNVIEREFLPPWREEFNDDFYLVEFDVFPFEVYQYGNIYLGNTSPEDLSKITKDYELYKSYAATSDEEFVEIELESVLVFMNLYRGKKKKEKKKQVEQQFAPDDIDF